MGRRIAFPLSLPWVVLALVVMKPLVDALTERSWDVSVDVGTLWAGSMLLVGVYWAFQQRSSTWPQVLVLLSILGLGLGSAVAAVAAPDHAIQIALEGVRLLAGLVPAVILLGVASEGRYTRYKSLLRLFALGVMVHSVAAALQYFGYLPATYFQVGQPRPSGLYFHPVSLGILVNASLLLVVLASCRRWIRLPTAVILAALLLVVGVVSTHRAGLVVAALILVSWPLIWFLVEYKRLRVSVGWLLGMSVAVVMLAMALYALPQGRALVASALDNVVGVISVDDLDPTAGRFLRGRGQLWAGATEAIAKGTWAQRLVGHGWQLVDPHSDYIRAVLVHGYAGALLVVFALGAIVLGFAARADRLGRLFIGLIVVCTLAYALTTKPTTYTFYMWAVTVLAWLAAVSSRPTGRPIEEAA